MAKLSYVHSFLLSFFIELMLWSYNTTTYFKLPMQLIKVHYKYLEKTINFEEISILVLTLLQIFVASSENLNFFAIFQ